MAWVSVLGHKERNLIGAGSSVHAVALNQEGQRPRLIETSRDKEVENKEERSSKGKVCQ